MICVRVILDLVIARGCVGTSGRQSRQSGVETLCSHDSDEGIYIMRQRQCNAHVGASDGFSFTFLVCLLLYAALFCHVHGDGWASDDSRCHRAAGERMISFLDNLSPVQSRYHCGQFMNGLSHD